MFDFTKIHLRSGAGNGSPQDGLCLMQMVDWFAGNERGLKDHPACACPVLTAFGIGLNDSAPSQAARDELWPLVFQLQGSRDESTERARAEFLVIEVAKGPLGTAWELMRMGEIAAEYRACVTIADVKRVSLKAEKAASAAEAAWAAEAAAWAAEAAVWAAEAAAWAAAAEAARAAVSTAWAAEAARAAEAAACAAEAAAEAAASQNWHQTKDIFAQAILLGKHGELDPILSPARIHKLVRVLEPNRA